MGEFLEEGRLTGEESLAGGRRLDTAHRWDGLRALARLVLGPDDPRVWALLSRSARSLSDTAESLGSLHGPETLEYHIQMLARSNYLTGAASMAAGALAGLRDAGTALPVSSGIMEAPGTDASWRAAPDTAGQAWETHGRAAPDTAGQAVKTDGRAAPDTAGQAGETDRRAAPATAGQAGETRGQRKARIAETAFAEATLAKCLGHRVSPPNDLKPPHPVKTLGAAVYSGRYVPEGDSDIYLSIGQLRERLSLAECPDGPGPGSREALVLRSTLGRELSDSGGRGTYAESLALLKEASAGLDALAGARDPDSLAAKERLARRLFGLAGPARIVPGRFDMPTTGETRLSLKLFRELETLAPAGRWGDCLRRRAGLGAFLAEFALSDRPGSGNAESHMSQIRSWLHPSEPPGLDAELARDAFDLGEIMLRHGRTREGLLFHVRALDLRRLLLGFRHPETASSLVRSGDLLCSGEMEDLGCHDWAVALEALETRGVRYERFRADLEFRIGRTFLFWYDAPLAAPLLSRSLGRYRAAFGEMSQESLETAALLGLALFWSGDVGGADGTFRALAGLLDGAPARQDPDPGMPSDGEVLTAARDALEVTSAVLGDPARGAPFLDRAIELLPDDWPESDVEAVGHVFRCMIRAMPDSFGASFDNSDGKA
jgi:hypothetical protein